MTSLIIAGCFWACRKDGKYTPIPKGAQALLVGKWTLQSEQVIQYIDGVQTIDTNYSASPNSYAAIQFNQNGTFSSTSFYMMTGGAEGGLSQNNVVSVDTTRGTFAVAGSSFNLSAPISGFSTGLNLYGITFTPIAPVITPVSNAITINQLTTSKLTLHTDYVYTSTVNNVSKTYKVEDDYYYVR
ncbi:MAG TPA: hypothetical protein VHC47_10240 [Mucilaginibacter sp.]|nr:hypothetical protein [Mucilaginibacter sp.]